MRAAKPKFTYERNELGELIRASKAQLHSFGIGAGAAFPGEGHAPVWTTDPRGYDVQLEHDVAGHFQAHIFYPGRVRRWPTFYGPRIAGLITEPSWGIWADCYMGLASDFVAAGLACMEQLPGQPGGPKVQVGILADGTTIKGQDGRRNEAGAMVITRVGKARYRVKINTTEAERGKRQLVEIAAHAKWELDQQRAGPPALLLAVHREIKRLATVEQEAQAPSTWHNGFWLRTAGAT